MVLNNAEREKVISSQMFLIDDNFSAETRSQAVHALASFLQAEAFEKIAKQLERIAAAQETMAETDKKRFEQLLQ